MAWVGKNMMTCLHSRIFHSTENTALLNGLLFYTVTFAFRATYVWQSSWNGRWIGFAQLRAGWVTRHLHNTTCWAIKSHSVTWGLSALRISCSANGISFATQLTARVRKPYTQYYLASARPFYLIILVVTSAKFFHRTKF